MGIKIGENVEDVEFIPSSIGEKKTNYIPLAISS